MKITFEGGLNENFALDVSECQEGHNFDLKIGDTDLKPRPPLDTKGIAPLGGNISGIMQLIKRDDTDTTLIFEDDGATPTIYKWDGLSTFTSVRSASVGSKLRDIYWSLDDFISIVDVKKLTPLLKWDGVNCSRQLTGLSSGNTVNITSITQVAGLATVITPTPHGLSTGDIAVMYGANEPEYNVEAEITVVNATTYTYLVKDNPATPATGTLTFEFGTEVYSKYAVVHQGREWLFNVRTNDGVTDSSQPHMCVASAFEEAETFDSTKRSGDAGFTTGNEAFYILTPDLKPINSVAVFNKQLVISTEKGRLFILLGTDSSNYQFIDYYMGSAAIGTESMVNMGNDIIYMRKGGNIESLVATIASSDVSANDVSRWIPDSVRDISESIAIYDQSIQVVYFFVKDKVIVLFKDILYTTEGKSPWSVYKTSLPFNFNTSAARYLRRPSEDTWAVYIGDSNGSIYGMSGRGSGDAGTDDIEVKRKSGPIETGDKAGSINGRIQYRRKGILELSLLFDWSDEYNISQSNITLNGPDNINVGAFFGGNVYFGGDTYFNQGISFKGKIGTKGFSPTGRGKTFTMEVYTATKIDFQVDNIEL